MLSAHFFIVVMFNVIRLRVMATFVSDAIKNTTSINREVSAL